MYISFTIHIYLDIVFIRKKKYVLNNLNNKKIIVFSIFIIYKNHS